MEINFDEKSCGVVVFREESNGAGTTLKFLLLHYPEGHWDFPKGHVEAGESEHETAVRELQEETGITDLRFVENFRTEISYTYTRSGRPSNKQVIFFLGQTTQSEVKTSFEHLTFKWLGYEDALKLLTFDNAKNVLKEAKTFLGF